MVDLGCQLYWVWTQVRDVSLSRFMRVFPGRNNWGWKTLHQNKGRLPAAAQLWRSPRKSIAVHSLAIAACRWDRNDSQKKEMFSTRRSLETKGQHLGRTRWGSHRIYWEASRDGKYGGQPSLWCPCREARHSKVNRVRLIVIGSGALPLICFPVLGRWRWKMLALTVGSLGIKWLGFV